MKKIFIVRHGETSLNGQGRMQGRVDLPLSSKGIKQAVLLRDRLKDLEFTKIYSSPLKRAIETAGLITEKNITVSKELVEFDFGNWDCRRIQEIKKKWPESFHTFQNSPAQFTAEHNGEDYHDLFGRIHSFFAAIEKDEKNILIVSHSFVIKAMLTIMHQRPIDRIWLPPMILPASLTIGEKDNGNWNIIIEGCCKHLKEEQSTTLKELKTQIIKENEKKS